MDKFKEFQESFIAHFQSLYKALKGKSNKELDDALVQQGESAEEKKLITEDQKQKIFAFEKENNKWFLRIFIYSSEHPVNHQDCENMSHSIGDLLYEIIPFKYYLEISSPGLDKKLKSEIEYQIFKEIGRAHV